MSMRSFHTDKLVNVAPTPSASQSRGPRTGYQNWLQVIGTWIDRHRQRRALARLDDHALNDVGITRSEAEREIAKPFWR